MVWNEVSTDFDTDEETANFGTRHALESEGNLYEVVTLATIEPGEQAVTTVSPQVRALATRDNVLVSADQCLLVFSPSCAEVTPLVFPHTINTISVSPCCRFLTAGLQNGSMQLVYLPAKRVLSGQVITEALDDDTGATFSCSLFTEDSMTLCTGSGEVITFSNIDLDSLDRFIKAGDMDNIKNIQGQITLTKSSVGQSSIRDCSVLNGVMIFATDRGLVKDMQNNDYLSIEGCIKIVRSRTDPTFVLCLDRDGTVSVVCSLTLVKIYSWKLTSRASGAEAVKDMVLLEDEGSPDIKLLVFTKDDIRDEQHLLLLDFPSFTITYRLPVSWFTQLVEPHISQDTPLLLEGKLEYIG